LKAILRYKSKIRLGDWMVYIGPITTWFYLWKYVYRPWP